MEPSGRNQWQPLADANEAGIAKQVKTVAVSCAQLPIGPHGTEGVGGSTRHTALEMPEPLSLSRNVTLVFEASPGPHEGAVWHPSTGAVVMEPCGFAPLREVGSINRPERPEEDEGYGRPIAPR